MAILALLSAPVIAGTGLSLIYGIRAIRFKLMGHIVRASLLLLAFGFLAFTYSFFVFSQLHPRSMVSKSVSTMRAMAAGIDSYYLETNSYPASTCDPVSRIWHPSRKRDEVVIARIPTYRVLPNSEKKARLSIIVDQLAGQHDPYGPIKKAPYGYCTTGSFGQGWILWSAGPDRDYDITIDNVAEIYDPSARVPSDRLIDMTYDPTNGTGSNGDLYRVGQ
jgi:hypothetical protein